MVMRETSCRRMHTHVANVQWECRLGTVHGRSSWCLYCTVGVRASVNRWNIRLDQPPQSRSIGRCQDVEAAICAKIEDFQQKPANNNTVIYTAFPPPAPS